MSRMRFGGFIAPHHPVGEHPTLQIERDLQMCELLDRLGYDEVWMGEHHSGGWETVGHPEMFLAAAAQRTKRIMLGTAVVSLPYHHPYNVAGRAVQLDHLSRGRAILGTGPGALPSDARTFGVKTTDLRDRQDEAIGVIKRLLTETEPFDYESDWFSITQGFLQIKPLQENLEIVTASSISPSGMKLAGKYGLGVISIASFTEEGLQALPTQWGFAETYAAENNQTVDRSRWRVLMPWHVARTREQAIDEVREGYAHWQNAYNLGVLGRPGQEITDPDRFIRGSIERGGVFVGTPDDVIEGIHKLVKVAGGFGTLLAFVHDWATPEQTALSYDMFARYVMPEIQGLIEPLRRSEAMVAGDKEKLAAAAGEGILKAIRDHNETHPRE